MAVAAMEATYFPITRNVITGFARLESIGDPRPEIVTCDFQEHYDLLARKSLGLAFPRRGLPVAEDSIRGQLPIYASHQIAYSTVQSSDTPGATIAGDPGEPYSRGIQRRISTKVALKPPSNFSLFFKTSLFKISHSLIH